LKTKYKSERYKGINVAFRKEDNKVVANISGYSQYYGGVGKTKRQAFSQTKKRIDEDVIDNWKKTRTYKKHYE
jgi:hypothetical protein